MSNYEHYLIQGNPVVLREIFEPYTPRIEDKDLAIYHFGDHPVTFDRKRGRVLSADPEIRARIEKEHSERNLELKVKRV